ncbi:hypothetical protein QC762_611060 [Podospora pseudocomata]|uniref:Secreted protein n=1 Tax=Podospora pseudocomata TaxID=2093779 RepID=A0ABR0G9Y3_9PEZI|nr:hypothetical protein QC762_611060 [Podospora pseudocomata]
MLSQLAFLFVAMALVTGRVVRHDTADGFPNPNATQLEFVEDVADGTLSDTPPPPSLNESSIPIFQLISFNENLKSPSFRPSLRTSLRTSPASHFQQSRKWRYSKSWRPSWLKNNCTPSMPPTFSSTSTPL